MRDKDNHFFRHAALISSFTVASRLLGLVRDMACAAFFGGGLVWDAFSFAFRIPNLFRRLFGEGALSVSSLPVFTEYLETRTRGEAVRLIRAVSTAMILVLCICLLAGLSFFIGLPFLAPLSERWRLAFALSAVLLPYMLFVCLSALAGAVLHSLRHFVVPAASSLILNGCWIVAVLVAAPLVSDNAREQIFVVAVGILIAGVVQLLSHLYALRRKGITYRPVFEFGNPGVRRIFAGMAPVALGMAAYQINVLLDGVIAISLAAPQGRETFSLFGRTLSYPMEVGANSALYFADRLMQFPLGIFGIALATAIFPALASCAAKKDWDGFSDTLTEGLGAVLFIAIPAGAGLALIGRPAITLLFERRAFTAQMSERTYMVLIAHSIGIWAYCGRHVMERAFFACGDRLTPVKIASFAIALNLCLNLIFIWFLAEAGLALATALCAMLQAGLLYVGMRKKTLSSVDGRLSRTLIKTAIATAFMVPACIAALYLLPSAPAGSRTLGAALQVFGVAAAGISVYLIVARALGLHELRMIAGIVLRRKGQDL